MAMGAMDELLGPETVQKLRRLLLRSRSVVEGNRSGGHKSPLRGASMEFADYRAYAKGDNLRSLDWKVFGRTERFYVKQFEEETNLRVIFLVDGSASMGFSSGSAPTKYRYACQLAAALGFLVTSQHDALGLAVFDQSLRTELPAKSGSRQLRNVVETLVSLEPSGKTATGDSLHTLADKISRRGLIILLSDLMDDPEGVFGAVAHFRKKHHDVIVLQILDPLEMDLTSRESLHLIDMEDGQRLEIDPVLARADYKKALREFEEECRTRCAAMQVDYRMLCSSDSFEGFLQQYLSDRKSRSR